LFLRVTFFYHIFRIHAPKITLKIHMVLILHIVLFGSLNSQL